MKGGRLLATCTKCFVWKVSCQTGGAGGRKKKTKKIHETTDSGETSEEDVRGRGWLERHSTITKVGPPIHARPPAADVGIPQTTQRTTTRNAGIEAKKRIERSCEYLMNFF